MSRSIKGDPEASRRFVAATKALREWFPRLNGSGEARGASAARNLDVDTARWAARELALMAAEMAFYADGVQRKKTAVATLGRERLKKSGSKGKSAPDVAATEREKTASTQIDLDFT